jgi:hypothetical protein
LLRGYPDHPSALIGGKLRIHVGCDETPTDFHAHFYRQGSRLEYFGRSAAFTAAVLPFGRPDEDWAWPTVDVAIPETWRPGVYIVLLLQKSDDPQRATLSEAQILNSLSSLLCVLRRASPIAHILYKLPLFTYQAYNDLGSPRGSLYTGRLTKVSLKRPGGGVGGHPKDTHVVDVYDTSSPRQTFAHWDAPMIRWLEDSGYVVDYCTDLDLHQDLGLLANYTLLLSVGHDEYWSPQLRSAVEKFIVGGGNVAFFSGNVCFWRVHVRDDLATIGQERDLSRPSCDLWQKSRPENSLTGVSYSNGGGSWDGAREPLGYTVQYDSHWVYENTGLTDGDTFGHEHHLVGYECDGAALSQSPGPLAYVMASGNGGTPASFIVLGFARLGMTWNDRPKGDLSVATLGLYTDGGTVFTAATTDWPRVLWSRDPTVTRITRNVLDRLSVSSMHIRCATVADPHMLVEGAKARFAVDPGNLRSGARFSCAWTSTSGSATGTGLTFETILPSPPQPVTVTATAYDGTECVGFGTLTFTPLGSQNRQGDASE